MGSDQDWGEWTGTAGTAEVSRKDRIGNVDERSPVFLYGWQKQKQGLLCSEATAGTYVCSKVLGSSSIYDADGLPLAGAGS